ncbi:synaptonemal complex central element protein 2 [Gasterosteus aculeatus]
MDFFFDDLALPSSSQSTSDMQHEEPHGFTAETHLSPDMPEDPKSWSGKSSLTSATEGQEQHTSSSIAEISRRVQELVEKMNDSRTTNQQVLDSFQEKLVEKVTETCQKMKEHMYTIYDETSKEMEVMLQELCEVLESCTKLNSELEEASQALESLRGALAITQASEP